jgi:hypothetical protein
MRTRSQPLQRGLHRAARHVEPVGDARDTPIFSSVRGSIGSSGSPGDDHGD